MKKPFLVISVVLLNLAVVQSFWLIEALWNSLSRYTDEVLTTSGPVIGTTSVLPTGKKVDKYLGIKYAHANRFEKPESPTPWTTPFEAFSFGNICPQNVGNVTVENEDCLFINVFVPNRELAEGELFHVMHWIHGGAYVSNSGDQIGADVLASEGDVIVVTSNYRLGALGFLSTSDTYLPGNYGMFDQLKALKWTQENIRSFGGDPTKVTLFGQSAGGFSTSLHNLSPKSANLFHRAIAQSGPGIGISSYVPTELAHTVATRFAAKLGCSLATLKSCASGKTVDQILAAQGGSFALTDYEYLTWGPVVEGDFLADLPENLLKAGQYNAKHVMMGVNNDEGALWLLIMAGPVVKNGLSRTFFEIITSVLQWTRNQTKEDVVSILFQYTNWNDPEDPISNRRNLMDLITDSVFAAPTVKTIQAYAENNIPTYFYQLQHGPDKDYFGPKPDWVEAYHGADIPYVFGIPLLEGSTAKESEVKFSKDIMKLWSDFAKTGNPTPSATSPAQWPQYSTDKKEYLALKPDAFEVQSHLRSDYMVFWNDFIPSQTYVANWCKNQRDGMRLPYPGDCTKYYECQGNVAIEKKCPRLVTQTTHFSIYTHKCTISCLSGCKNESKRRK